MMVAADVAGTSPPHARRSTRPQQARGQKRAQLRRSADALAQVLEEGIPGRSARPARENASTSRWS
jgi:hypothetical protein